MTVLKLHFDRSSRVYSDERFKQPSSFDHTELSTYNPFTTVVVDFESLHYNVCNDKKSFPRFFLCNGCLSILENFLDTGKVIDPCPKNI